MPLMIGDEDGSASYELRQIYKTFGLDNQGDQKTELKYEGDCFYLIFYQASWFTEVINLTHHQLSTNLEISLKFFQKTS